MYPVYSPLTGHDINQILAIKIFYLLKNNNNNDRLTAFDPGQPG